MFIGCGDPYRSERDIIIKDEKDLRLIIIDSCEYYEYSNGVFDNHVYSLTHKGNCKYCLQRNKNR